MYIILTNFAYADDDTGNEDRKSRLYHLQIAIFSLGAAWSCSQDSIIVNSALNIEEVSGKISQFIKDGDLVVIINQETMEVVTIGFLADEEGFDRLVPDAKKIGISPSGIPYPLR